MSNLIDSLGKAVAGFSGNPFDLLKGLKKLPANRWDPVSVNGHHVGKVTKHDLGVVLPNSAWASWDWDATAGGQHSLRIEAKAGSADVEVTLDGAVVDQKGRLQVRPIVQGLSVKISVRVHFVNNGVAAEYRFDGRSAP